MSPTLFVGLWTCLCLNPGNSAFLVAPGQKAASNDSPKATSAAEITRSKLLKVKVNIERKDDRLGDILKELAAQVEMQAEQPLMWTYGMGFPHSKRVTITLKDQPLDVALDQLLREAGGTLGYVVVSKDGDRHDGWVKLTTSGERGTEPMPATPQEEQDAASQLQGAKKLLEKKLNDSARVLLERLVKTHPTTKAATEAREILGKLEK